MKDLLARARGTLFRWRCRAFSPRIVVGRALRLYCRLHVAGPGRVTIGDSCTIARMPGAYGTYVAISTHSQAASVTIGHGAALFSVRISSKYKISLGNTVRIEESGLSDTDFHSIDPGRPTAIESPERSTVTVGDRVVIGARSEVCKGVVIGDDAVILPGTVVTRNVPASAAVCGNPARILTPASG